MPVICDMKIMFDNIPAWNKSNTKKVQKAVRQAGFFMEAKTKYNITNVPHFVRKKEVGKGAIDTGNMLASVAMEHKDNNNIPEAAVKVGVKYAAYVEYGTYKMEARAFFVPAYKEAKNFLINEISK